MHGTFQIFLFEEVFFASLKKREGGPVPFISLLFSKTLNNPNLSTKRTTPHSHRHHTTPNLLCRVIPSHGAASDGRAMTATATGATASSAPSPRAPPPLRTHPLRTVTTRMAGAPLGPALAAVSAAFWGRPLRRAAADRLAAAATNPSAATAAAVVEGAPASIPLGRALKITIGVGTWFWGITTMARTVLRQPSLVAALGLAVRWRFRACWAAAVEG